MLHIERQYEVMIPVSAWSRHKSYYATLIEGEEHPFYTAKSSIYGPLGIFVEKQLDLCTKL